MEREIVVLWKKWSVMHMLRAEVPICQSCAMPMEDERDFSSNADGSKNQLELATQRMGMTKDEAREMTLNVLPNLKRWQTAT